MDASSVAGAVAKPTRRPRVTKPSATQLRVLRRMLNGWELAMTGGRDSRSWLQHGGAGRGGPAETVSFNTLHALRERGWIRCASESYPISRYALTSAGLDVARNGTED